MLPEGEKMLVGLPRGLPSLLLVITLVASVLVSFPTFLPVSMIGQWTPLSLLSRISGLTLSRSEADLGATAASRPTHTALAGLRPSTTVSGTLHASNNEVWSATTKRPTEHLKRGRLKHRRNERACISNQGIANTCAIT
jgi:hypothetical protein